MQTVRHKRFSFEILFFKEILADFSGGPITSDAGGLLHGGLDHHYRLTDKAARCLHDPRDSRQVLYDLLARLRQSRFAASQGQENDNDAVALARF